MWVRFVERFVYGLDFIRSTAPVLEILKNIVEQMVDEF